MNEEKIKRVTSHVKVPTDEKPLSLDDVDTVLKRWGNNGQEYTNREGKDL